MKKNLFLIFLLLPVSAIIFFFLRKKEEKPIQPSTHKPPPDSVNGEPPELRSHRPISEPISGAYIPPEPPPSSSSLPPSQQEQQQQQQQQQQFDYTQHWTDVEKNITDLITNLTKEKFDVVRDGKYITISKQFLYAERVENYSRKIFNPRGEVISWVKRKTYFDRLVPAMKNWELYGAHWGIKKKYNLQDFSSPTEVFAIIRNRYDEQRRAAENVARSYSDYKK